jgi:predicted CoA-substrate-specific enzyme activase
MRRLGLDLGSLYLGCVLLEEGRVVATRYLEHHGDIAGALQAVLAKGELSGPDRVGVTGALGLLDGEPIDSTLAVVEGTRFLLPGSRNVFCIGGETFSLICFDERGGYQEHSVNSPCAAGTGSFVEQQAERLKLSVQELARRAERYRGRVPQVATRCAVFAKTDIIHAMQEGYSVEAVCAGLCEGIARNVLDVLVKGRRLVAPVGVVGGVSLNAKVVRAMEEQLGCAVAVPANAQLAGAVGAALLGEGRALPSPRDCSRRGARQAGRTPLQARLSHYPDWSSFCIYRDGEVEVFLPRRARDIGGGVYLGIDVGSTSTKCALLDGKGELAGGFYTSTGGEPAAALGRLVRSIGGAFGEGSLRLLGAATTGSGRKIIKELFRADLEIDEITAHARAAVALNPRVDTILEIGGQDSKFTRIREGEVYFSTMNYACAAGTGSFIEEQAGRLGVDLERFSRMAFGAPAPYTSDRCTVYMERDLGVLLSEGWSREAVAAAVLHSVRDNYLAKVVSRSPIGEYVVFQGATGRNRALIAAFEQSLNKPIHVSPYCHLTGAMGAAMACIEAGLQSSGFYWDVGEVVLQREVCTLCANRCLLTVAVRGERRSAWGMKCGREYGSARRRRSREAAVEKRYLKTPQRPPALPGVPAARGREVIGLPRTLYNAEYFPLWRDFLSLLGFTVLPGRPSRGALASGKALVNSEFCAPMVIAHGYFEQLLSAGAGHIFCPAVINEEDPDYRGELKYRRKTSDSYFCYYSEYLPTLIDRLTTLELGERLLSPLLRFNRATVEEIARELHGAMSPAFPDLRMEEVREAFITARRRFRRLRRRRARAFARLAGGGGGGVEPAVVLLGRPYVVFDPVLNLGLPQKLEGLGARVFWQEELELDAFQPEYAGRYYERMNWHYGKRILKAAELCARTEGLYAVFLTCFRCSPDAFLISYVKDIMDRYGKPFLVLQLDEHHSDVGYTTRIEAGLRSFRNFQARGRAPSRPQAARPRDDSLGEGDTVLVPCLDHLISGFLADSFIRSGYRALALEADEKALSTGYQYANGGECMPLVSIMGGAIEKVREEKLDPRRTFLYLPTSCYACNFPQFPILSDLVFQGAGLPGLKIGLINGMDTSAHLPQSLAAKLFESYIAGSLLYKLYNRIKPYEVEAGRTELALRKARETIGGAIRSGADLRAACAAAVEPFRAIPRDESGGRRPRIALLGDLYVKYNEVVNRRVQGLIEELGGELVVPSMTEYALHYFHMDVTFFGDDPRHYRLLRAIESRYERLAADLIGEQLEPDLVEGAELMKGHRLRHYIAGETSINVGRALHHLTGKSVEAIVHVNPIFCCPGVVTASIYRKLQAEFGVPIIDIFYDGTGSPNRVLVPHMHYLRRERRQSGS